MSIPDLPTVPEISSQSKSGLKYHIMGTVQQTLAIDLQPGQTVFSDTGAMSWMTATVNMNTTSAGGLGGMLKRAVSGATAFIINFTAKGAPGQAAFSTDFPGKILPLELEAGQSVVMHKHAFLCAEKSVGLDIFFTRRLGVGMFAGEGFILQKLTGPGMTFAELDGDAIEYHPTESSNARRTRACRHVRELSGFQRGDDPGTCQHVPRRRGTLPRHAQGTWTNLAPFHD